MAEAAISAGAAAISAEAAVISAGAAIRPAETWAVLINANGSAGQISGRTLRPRVIEWN
jgi:hypothetical protein